MLADMGLLFVCVPLLQEKENWLLQQEVQLYKQ